jgi:hypothetical protein
VLQDDIVRFIEACSDPIQYAIDAHTLETNVVSRDLALANEIGFACIIIESG